MGKVRKIKSRKVKRNKKTRKTNKTRKTKETRKTKKTKKSNKSKKTKKVSSDTLFESIKNDFVTTHISNKKASLSNKKENFSIQLIQKFKGGKSGDLVFLIMIKNKKYILKIFMDVKTSTNEINIHLKINILLKNDNQLATIIY